jgi:GNAT superfamily N-acetyltransferase
MSSPRPAQVRLARMGDLDAVVRLLASLHDEKRTDEATPAERDAFERILRQPMRRVLVADLGGRVVGTADVLVVENLSRGVRPWAIVENVVVDPGSRRRGVGGALINAATDFADESGCYKIQLVSNRARVEARSLYRELGFDAEVEGFRKYLREVSVYKR